MKPPDNSDFGNPESQEIVVGLLHPDQLERAREMQFDAVRLARFIDIAQKSKSIHSGVSSLDPRVYAEISRLNDIVQKTVNDSSVEAYSFPSELTELFEQSLDQIQETLVSDENILSMSKFFNSTYESGDVMNFVLFVFHVWSKFPELRWGLNGDTENSERAVEYVRLCDLYLGSYHTGDAMVLVPSQTSKGIKTLVGSISIQKVRAQKDKPSLDSFAKFCIDPGADDEKNMAYLEEIILLGGWVADDFIVGEIPVKIRNLFIKKHLGALQEKGLLYEEFSKFFTSKNVLDKLMATSIEGLSNGPIKIPKARSAKKVTTRVQKAVVSGISNPTIPLRIDQISRSGFSIAGCSDGTIVSLEISNEKDRRAITVEVEGGRVSLTPVTFDPLVDYKVQAIITSEAPKQSKYATIDPILLASPIKEFVGSTAPKIRKKVENSIIRLGESTNVGEFIENFSGYEAYIGIALRKVGTKEWKKYTMTDTIDFGSIDPGNYELCFFILSDDLTDETGKNNKISTFTRKLIIGSSVSTDDKAPPPPPPPRGTNREGLKSDGNSEPKKDEINPNEERILEIALVLERRKAQEALSVTRSADGLSYVFLIHSETESETTFTCDRKGRISDGLNDLMTIAGDDLGYYMDQCDLSIEEAETKRLSGKLSMTIAYLYTVFQKSLGSTFREEQLLNLPELIGNYRMGSGYAGAAVFQPWGKQDLTNFQEQLRQSGIHSAISKPGEKIGHLDISISLNGEDHVSGRIRTTDSAPFYVIILDPKCGVKIGEILKGILEKSYLIFGYLAWQRLTPVAQSKGAPQAKGGSSSGAPGSLTTYEKISRLIRSPLGDTHLDADQGGEIEKVWESFVRGAGKVCSTIRSNALGYETYDIHGKRTLTDITEPQNAHLLVVMKDENISSLPDGMKGNPYSFTRVEENPRLQKYLISRVIATLYEEQKNRAGAIKSRHLGAGIDLKIEANRRILNREIETALGEEFGTILQSSDAQGKAPFSGTMNGGFILLWQGLDKEKQKEFLRLALRSKPEALKFEIQNGETIISTLLASWRKNGVEICYRRPQLMTAAELKHIKTLYSTHQVESV